MIHVCPVFHTLMIRTCYSNKLTGCERTFQIPQYFTNVHEEEAVSVSSSLLSLLSVLPPLSLSPNGIKPLPLVTSNCNALY